jgi:hypothetical protein
VWKLLQEVGKDKSSAFLNETSDNPYSSSSGAAYDFYSLNRLKAAGGKCDKAARVQIRQWYVGFSSWSGSWSGHALATFKKESGKRGRESEAPPECCEFVQIGHRCDRFAVETHVAPRGELLLGCFSRVLIVSKAPRVIVWPVLASHLQ